MEETQDIVSTAKDTGNKLVKVGSPVISWLLAAILAILVWNSVGHIPKLMPTTWEYMIKSVPDTGFDQEMNKLGQEGWEVVFARRASNGIAESPTFSYEVIFKRQK